MPMKARLHLAHQNKIYRLISAELKAGDGSLLLSMVRAGMTDSNVHVSVGPQQITVSSPRTERKGFRVTYHPTGQLNYHQMSGGSIFMEPLFAISRIEPLVSFSVPDVTRLDELTTSDEEHAVIEAPSGRLSFTAVIAPWDAPIRENNVVWAWTWRPLFSLWLIPSLLPPALHEQLPDHFHYVPRPSGLFKTLRVPKDRALVSFHQALNNCKTDIVYPPNGEGVCRIIYVVPMRCAPNVELGFRDRSITAEIIKCTNTEIRYRARDAQQRIVRDIRSVEIARHVREAEL